MQEPGQSSNCPFLIPRVTARPGVFSVPAYCRQPNGRIRVPSREQVAVLCIAGHHRDCPAYRRWKPIRRGAGRSG